MTVFSVDSGQLTAASSLTRAQVDKIRTDVTTMMAQLRHLQGSWTGVAAAGFASCAEQWQAAQIQVEQALEAISAQLAFAANTYSEAENRAAALFH